MCPLRLILIFLSATLAGFFLLKNLKPQPQILQLHYDDSINADSESSVNSGSVNFSSKVWGVMRTGFRTCLDMASGRYLWRNLVSSSPSSSKRSN